MAARQIPIHRMTLGLLGCLALATTGCMNHFGHRSGDPLLHDPPGAPSAVSPHQEIPASYQQQSAARPATIIVRPEFGRPQRAEIPVSKGMTVSGALKQLDQKIPNKRWKVHLWRMADNDRLVKMEVRYHPRRRKVEPSTDYALHPGDKILFKEDSESAVSGLLRQALGPLAGGLMSGDGR